MSLIITFNNDGKGNLDLLDENNIKPFEFKISNNILRLEYIEIPASYEYFYYEIDDNTIKLISADLENSISLYPLIKENIFQSGDYSLVYYDNNNFIIDKISFDYDTCEFV